MDSHLHRLVWRNNYQDIDKFLTSCNDKKVRKVAF